jgi:hypothetical protein
LYHSWPSDVEHYEIGRTTLIVYVRAVMVSGATTLTKICVVVPAVRGMLGEVPPLATTVPFTVTTELLAVGVAATVIDGVPKVTLFEYAVVAESNAGVSVPADTVSDRSEAVVVAVPPVPMSPDPLPSQATIATTANAQRATTATRRCSRVAISLFELDIMRSPSPGVIRLRRKPRATVG